jgi:two-component system, cell cycle response regulator
MPTPAHILVIEDNAPNLELMTYLLRAFGYSVSTAEDGDEGLKATRGKAPDLVICDVHLPTVSGYEVARRMKEDPTTKEIAIVAVTALAMVGDRDKVLAAGFDGYVAKPITPELFVSQVERFLGAEQLSKAGPALHSTSSSGFEHSSVSYRATILAVDDVVVNIALIKSILEPCGYRIIGAASVEEAILACQQYDPDLIISDLHLADGSGYDLLKWLRDGSHSKFKPLLFLSATASAQDRQRALESGALKLLERPIEPEVLLAEIASALSSR